MIGIKSLHVSLGLRVGTTPSTLRICSEQALRANPPFKSVEEYYRISISVPFLDHLSSQLDLRFTPEKIEVLKKGFLLIPFHMFEALQKCNGVQSWKSDLSDFIDRYESDLPLFRNTDTELEIWLHFWSSKRSETLIVKETLRDSGSIDIYKNHISVHLCSSPNLSNDPNYHLSMRTMYFSITTSQDVFTKYYDARTT